MNERISKLGKIFSENEVMHCQKNSLQQVYELFSQKSSIVFEEERSKVWKRIQEDCENYTNSVIVENEENKRQIKQEIYKISEKLEELYEQKINDLNISAMSEKDLEAKLTEYCKEAVQKYNEKTEDWKDFFPDVLNKMDRRLVNKLSERSERSKEKKEMEERSKKLAQKEEMLNIQSAVREVEIEFEKEKAEILEEYHTNISKKLERKMFNQMKIFEGKCSAIKNRTKVGHFEEKLLGTLRESIVLAEIENTKTEEKLTSVYREITKAACKEYERIMEECLLEGPVGKDKLSQHHENCKSCARKIFDDKVKTMKIHLGQQAIEKFIQELNGSIQKKYIDGFKKANEMNLALKQEKDSAECVGHMKSVLDKYTKELNELLANGAYFEDEELKLRHDIREKRLIEEFMELIADLSERQKFIESLKEQIQAKFLQFKTTNSDNRHKALENQKRELIKTAVHQYTDSREQLTMNNIIEQEIIEDESLEEKHIEFKNKALETLSNNSVIENDDLKDVKQTLDNIHLRIKAMNNSAREKEKFKADKQKLHLEILKTKKDDCRNEFIGEISKHGKEYKENFETICRDTKEKILEKFDDAVEHLKENVSEEDLKNTKKDLKLEINKKIEIARVDNIENQAREKRNMEIIVSFLKISLRSELNKYMKKHYIKPSSLDEIEEDFLNRIKRMPIDNKVREKLICAIKKETEEAREQNMKNEGFRIFTLDYDHIIKELTKFLSDLFHRIKTVCLLA
ncbi:uncharacterized protein LOC144427400 isoform X2 [Styela clava]